MASKKSTKKAVKEEGPNCTFTRSEVAAAVLGVIREKFGDATITENSDFEDDIGADADAKGLLFVPLKRALKREGCQLKKFSPTACEKADTPKDMIDAICKDFGVT
jgi:hypothetical protein